jgi:hypothetical protein
MSLDKPHQLILPFSQKLRCHGQQVDYVAVSGVDHFDIVENLQQQDFILTRAIAGLVTGGLESVPDCSYDTEDGAR